MVKTMKFDMNFAKKWVLPVLIISAAFTLLPTSFNAWFGPMLGPSFGTWTGYLLSAAIAAIALWFVRYTEKKI